MRTIKIHGDNWDIDYIKAMLSTVRQQRFEKAQWQSRDALVSKDGSRATIYTGQPFDAAKFTIQKNFWDHDHCEVCNWTFSTFEGPDHTAGYLNGYNWLCSECHDRFVVGNELKAAQE